MHIWNFSIRCYFNVCSFYSPYCFIHKASHVHYISHCHNNDNYLGENHSMTLDGSTDALIWCDLRDELSL